MVDTTISWIDITGPLNKETPHQIRNFIFEAHGFNPDDKISTNRIISILNQDRLDLTDPREKASFVNPQTSWTWSSLQTAYQYIIKFIGISDRRLRQDMHLVYQDFFQSSGLPTPDQPKETHFCILYGLIRSHGIPTRPETTYRQLQIELLHLLFPTAQISAQLSQVFSTNRLLDQEPLDLAQLYGHLNFQVNSGGETSETVSNVSKATTQVALTPKEIRHFYSSHTSLQSLQRQIIPQSPGQAIILAAINYKLDLTYSLDPMVDYQQLTKKRKDQQFSPRLKQIISHHRQLIRLKHHFNPLFPKEYYLKIGNLQKLGHLYGLHIDQTPSLDEIYEQLIHLVSQWTVEFGWIPEIDEQSIAETSIFYEPISQLSQLIIIWNRQDQEQPGVYGLDELIESFRATKDFIDPLTHHKLPIPVVNRIRRQAQTQLKNFYDSYNQNKWKTLEKTMQEIVETKQQRALEISNFRDIYENLHPHDQEILVTMLEMIHNLGMYMRGWTPDQEYPISEAQKVNIEECEIRVQEAFYKLRLFCQEHDHLAEIIYRLPQLKFLENHGEVFNFLRNLGTSTPNSCDLKDLSHYEQVNDQEKGFTLGDRLDIIENNEGVNSCFRMSSNYIISTVYYYLLLIDRQPPYDLKLLRHIF